MLCTPKAINNKQNKREKINKTKIKDEEKPEVQSWPQEMATLSLLLSSLAQLENSSLPSPHTQHSTWSVEWVRERVWGAGLSDDCIMMGNCFVFVGR